MSTKRSRSVVLLLSFVALLAAWQVSAQQVTKGAAPHEHPSPVISGDVSPALQAHPPSHRKPTIDGAVTPQLISDERALSIFLLMAADDDPKQADRYLSFVINGGLPEASHLDAQTLRAIHAVAVEYNTNVKALYRSRETAAHRELSDLTRNYGAQVVRLFGANGSARMSHLLQSRIKPKMRVFAKP